jgi:hypothetical protein
MKIAALMKKYDLSQEHARAGRFYRNHVDKLLKFPSDHEFDQSSNEYKALVYSTQFRADVLDGIRAKELSRRYCISEGAAQRYSIVVKQAQKERIEAHQDPTLDESVTSDADSPPLSVSHSASLPDDSAAIMQGFLFS